MSSEWRTIHHSGNDDEWRTWHLALGMGYMLPRGWSEAHGHSKTNHAWHGVRTIHGTCAGFRHTSSLHTSQGANQSKDDRYH